MSPVGTIPQKLAQLLEESCDIPIAIVRRKNSAHVTVFSGTVASAPLIGDIPLDGEEILALVPYHQIHERGYEAVVGDEKLLYLVVDEKWEVALEDLLSYLPASPPALEDIGFDLTDEEYAGEVSKIIKDEIGNGVGANFVIRRDYRAKTDASQRHAALAWLAQLLSYETGAYWTCAFVGGGVALACASPERHVSAEDGKVLMNPISGTFRHRRQKPTVERLLNFLNDRKESEELVMVVDEELKMMAALCPDGGVMRGPYLKPMSQLTHTEYLLEGKSDLDLREILRVTMFAPTVIGSPMGSACEVIARYEKTPRGYYSGVFAHFEPTETGYRLDAPILIRAAFIDEDGNITISAGATLVRHSDPASEAKETRVKVSGALTALGLLPRTTVPGGTSAADIITDERVQETLKNRNTHLAPFWRDEQPKLAQRVGSALIVDAGDDFTAMLAHQLHHLGLETITKTWSDVTGDEAVDLVIYGPGPGDPIDLADPRVARLRALMAANLSAGKPMAAVCFSHQILASLAGLPIEKLAEPRQGLPLMIDFLGEDALIGFYNTFAAIGDNKTETPKLSLTISADPDTKVVNALVGSGVVSVQGHLESVLSLDGFPALARLVDHVLAT